MDVYSIINQFSPEENTAFKAYLGAKNKRTDTKNIQLYALLKKGTPTKDIDSLLYGHPNRNAYHALSKRLQDSLIDFIASRSFERETSEDMEVFKWILTARILYEQNIPKPARKLLLKASKKAKDLDLYAALIESDHTQLQYSHLHPEIDLNALTKTTQENRKIFLQQEQLNLAYAHIKRALTLDEQLLTLGIQQTIENIFARFDINLDSRFTYKSLYQLLEIINTGAHLDHNFDTALPFISKIYGLIQEKKGRQEKQQYYHIQVLYFMANAHFRVRDFSTANTYLHTMKEELAVAKPVLKKHFTANYLLVYSLTLNYSNQAKEAIAILESFLQKNKKNVLNPDCTLALTVYYTQQEQFKMALTTLNTLRHTDSWYEERHGLDWLIKKDLITLILFYELEYLDLVQSYLRRINRKYRSIINSEKRLKNFITVFNHIYKDPAVVNESRFRESVKNLFTRDSLKDEDIFMLSFFAWIKAKLNDQPLYQTTLSSL